MVSSTGNISVPYVGPVHVAGRTLPEIEHEIQGKLERSALEPQVVVTLADQNSSTVTVIGDAVASGKLKLTGAGERILDIISKVGGIRLNASDVFVTLRRKNRQETTYFPTLVNNPKENIFVEPGDLLYVYADPRKYIALGATGASSGGASGGAQMAGLLVR